MKITEHALKRLDLILGNHYAHLEVKFMHEYLLPGAYTIEWSLGLQVKDIELFSKRCERFGLRFLGCETHLESPFPLHIYSFEDYEPNYNSKWISGAIKNLELMNVTQYIVPTISVPATIIKQYLSLNTHHMNIEDVLENRDFPDYTPFSLTSNPLYFMIALTFLKDKLKENILCQACIEHFEELVNECTDLQVEYVEYYHKDNQFFVVQSAHQGHLFDIYFITRYGEILMFFTRHSQ